MTELDNIKQHLEEARSAIDNSVAVTAQAAQTASDKSAAFAGLGAEGVAQVLNSANEVLSSASVELTSGREAADAAVTLLTGVSDKTRVSETVTALTAASEKLTAVTNHLKAAASHVDQALELAQQSEVEPVIASINAAVSAVADTQQATETAKAACDAHTKKLSDAAGN